MFYPPRIQQLRRQMKTVRPGTYVEVVKDCKTSRYTAKENGNITKELDRKQASLESGDILIVEQGLHSIEFVVNRLIHPWSVPKIVSDLQDPCKFKIVDYDFYEKSEAEEILNTIPCYMEDEHEWQDGVNIMSTILSFITKKRIGIADLQGYWKLGDSNAYHDLLVIDGYDMNLQYIHPKTNNSGSEHYTIFDHGDTFQFVTHRKNCYYELKKDIDDFTYSLDPLFWTIKVNGNLDGRLTWRRTVPEFIDKFEKHEFHYVVKNDVQQLHGRDDTVLTEYAVNQRIMILYEQSIQPRKHYWYLTLMIQNHQHSYTMLNIPYDDPRILDEMHNSEWIKGDMFEVRDPITDEHGHILQPHRVYQVLFVSVHRLFAKDIHQSVTHSIATSDIRNIYCLSEHTDIGLKSRWEKNDYFIVTDSFRDRNQVLIEPGKEYQLLHRTLDYWVVTDHHGIFYEISTANIDKIRETPHQYKVILCDRIRVIESFSTLDNTMLQLEDRLTVQKVDETDGTISVTFADGVWERIMRIGRKDFRKIRSVYSVLHEDELQELAEPLPCDGGLEQPQEEDLQLKLNAVREKFQALLLLTQERDSTIELIVDGFE